MTIKEIKIKLELTSINIYAGGAEQLLDDIKNAGIVIHNDSNGYYITSESKSKYSASTDYAEKLNQLKILTVLSPEETEIAKLKILFLDNETDEPYTVSDNATIEGETINLTFNSYTLTFTNTEYPQFDIELPDAMIVPEGTSVVLPSVSGSFEDEEYTYTPSAWSIGNFIGNFGESVEIDDNTTANILCSMVPKLLLPTITDNGDFGGTNNWFLATEDGHITPISSGSSFSGYFIVDGNSRIVTYDSEKKYAIIKWSNTDQNAGRVEFQCVSVNGNFGAQNVTNETLSFFQAKVAVCSSNNATVVTVYDSQNNSYNSFKFILNGTDYYYVLDEVQNDWTDDLSSIGYSLEPTVLYAYPQSGGEAGLANSSWSKGSYYAVYSPDGLGISPSPGYTITAVYRILNNVLTKYEDEYAFKFNFRYSASYLQARQYNSTSYNVAKIEYKDLPTEKAYLNQTSHSSNWDFPYNTNTLLYADDGSYIPYDTSKRYVMTCASKKDGTLVAAELTPVNMDGYLGYRISSTGQACFIYYTMS